MAKCYLTGLEVPVEKSYVLDRGAAQRALRNLKQRVATVERLIAQLGPKDEVEDCRAASGRKKPHSRRRLVCPTVAAALAATYPEAPLFLSWPEFVHRKPLFPQLHPKPRAGRPTNPAASAPSAEATHAPSC